MATDYRDGSLLPPLAPVTTGIVGPLLLADQNGVASVVGTANPLPVQILSGSSGQGSKAPFTLFDATVVGTTLLKTLWPGPLDALTLPAQGSGTATPLKVSTVTVGAVLAVKPNWSSLLLDFAALGAASQHLVVEIGKLGVNGAMPTVLGSVDLESIVTSGTIANVNPFTGVATPAKTWRMFDLVAITAAFQLGQLLVSVGGVQDNTPAQLTLDVSEAPWYYVLVTNLNSLTEALCVVTPQ